MQGLQTTHSLSNLGRPSTPANSRSRPSAGGVQRPDRLRSVTTGGRGRSSALGTLSAPFSFMRRKPSAPGPVEEASHPRGIRPSGSSKVMHDIGGTVISVAFSSDNELYAAGGTDKIAHVWNNARHEELAAIHLDDSITCLLFAKDHNAKAKLLVATMGGTIHVFDVETQREELAQQFGRGDKIESMAIAGAGSREQTLVVGGRFVIVYRFAFVEGEQLEFRELCHMKPTGGLFALAIDKRGELLVTGGEAKVVEIWSIPRAIEGAKPGGRKPSSVSPLLCRRTRWKELAHTVPGAPAPLCRPWSRAQPRCTRGIPSPQLGLALAAPFGTEIPRLARLHLGVRVNHGRAAPPK